MFRDCSLRSKPVTLGVFSAEKEGHMISKRFSKEDVAQVTFAVNVDADVEGVSLVCEAFNWDPIPMDGTKTGDWIVKVLLPVDQEIQFRYLASGGIWLNDTAADSYVDGGHGVVNSVVNTHRS